MSVSGLYKCNVKTICKTIYKNNENKIQFYLQVIKAYSVPAWAMIDPTKCFEDINLVLCTYNDWEK